MIVQQYRVLYETIVATLAIIVYVTIDHSDAATSGKRVISSPLRLPHRIPSIPEPLRRRTYIQSCSVSSQSFYAN